MPLTRHLYREDEVIAALQLSVLRGRGQDACFWALELLDSSMSPQLEKAMDTIWLYGFGASALSWRRAWLTAWTAEELEESRVLLLVAELARATSCRDASVVALLGAAAPPAGAVQPDRVNEWGYEGEGATAFVRAALWQGKTLLAWWVGRAEGILTSEFLAAVAEAKHGSAGVEALKGLDLASTSALAVAVAAISLPPTTFQASWTRELRAELAPEIATAVAEWQGLLGRRRRRALAVPVDCLYWATARGRTMSVYDSNVKELYRMERSAALWGSEFWDEAVAERGGWPAVRSDDEVREWFYDTFFPDDIPDEWSRADQAKSHGGGVLQRGATATLSDWVRRWFGDFPCSVVWGGIGLALKSLAAADRQSLDEPPPPPDLGGWNLKPVAVRKLVVA
jgi:hypothetical protein